MNKPNPISDIGEVKKLIEELKTIDLKTASVERLQPYFNKIMNGYSVVAFMFNPGFVLYRGIKYSNKPNNYEDIIYPPKDRAKLNRAS